MKNSRACDCGVCSICNGLREPGKAEKLKTEEGEVTSTEKNIIEAIEAHLSWAEKHNNGRLMSDQLAAKIMQTLSYEKPPCPLCEMIMRPGHSLNYCPVCGRDIKQRSNGYNKTFRR